MPDEGDVFVAILSEVDRSIVTMVSASADRIVHNNTIWMETGGTNMREHTANTA